MVYQGSWGINKSMDKRGIGKQEVNRGKLQVFPSGTTKPYFPALLVPLKEKDEFLMPYWHDHHLRYAFQEAEVAYLIGGKEEKTLYEAT